MGADIGGGCATGTGFGGGRGEGVLMVMLWRFVGFWGKGGGEFFDDFLEEGTGEELDCVKVVEMEFEHWVFDAGFEEGTGGEGVAPGFELIGEFLGDVAGDGTF